MSRASGYTTPSIAGYTITEHLHSGAASLVYRATRTADGKPVVLKLLNTDDPSPAALRKFRREYDLVNELKLPGVVQVYALEPCNTTLALILEDFGGTALKPAIGATPLDTTTFLTIALQLADILGAVHQRGILHKDIKPQNIIYNPTSGQIKLTDFGIAARLSQASQPPTPRTLEGSLPYIAPEQTGRMNHAIDYRSDYYSLGVTLYEILTGDLPFQASDPMELVHAHMARMPIPPHEVKPSIPRVISDIVMKLLAKTADDRYQNAYGLKTDLQRCLDHWSSTGQIDPFPLGAHNISGVFHIPHKLYGRETEIQTLRSAFEIVVNTRVTELVLVAGQAGTGKSVLVHELQNLVTLRHGSVLTGKFEQHSTVPYSGFIQAFQELIQHLLSESAERIADWNTRLAVALGSNGQVIVDVIPDVELIIGPQPEVPQLGLTEAENRFNRVLQQFIQVFANDKQPLVLFLDDLQWADLASLTLLQMLATDAQTQNVLIIGAYRDTEVTLTHPLVVTLDDLHQRRTAVTTIKVHALQRNDVHALVSETLHRDTDHTAPLADLVYEKTAGNAFFVNQFLRSLHDDGLIVFDNAAGQWTWDLDQINARSMSDNVLTFLAEKIQKYEPATQRILMQAACIGRQFEMDLLSVVAGESPARVAAQLWPALREGLIIPIGHTMAHTDAIDPMTSPTTSIQVAYRFLHDRVRQAAYSLIDDEEKQQIHLTVGRLILANTPSERIDERVFEVVNHLNHGVAFITEPAERLRIAEMNLLAGQKAKASTAYAAARDYLAVGMQYLPADVWEQHYALALDYYKQRSECEYLTGHFATAEAYLAVVLQRAQSNLEKVDVYITHTLLYTHLANFATANSIGLTGLKEIFGVEIIEDTTLLQDAVAAGMATIPTLLGTRSIDALIDSPVLTDPERLAEMRYLMALVAPTYNTNPLLMSVIVLRMMTISLTEGHAPESAFGYGMLGVLCATARADYTSAAAYGRLALQLSEQFKSAELHGKVLHLVAYFLDHWRAPMRATLDYEQRAYVQSLDVGDFVFAGLAYWAWTKNSLLSGADLNALCSAIDHAITFGRQSKNQGLLATAIVTQQMIRALRGETASRDSLADGTFNEEHFLAEMNQQRLFLISNLYYIYKMMLCIIYGDYRRALVMQREAEATIDSNLGSYLPPVCMFWSALTFTGLYATASADDQVTYKTRLTGYLEQFKVWAAHSPANYRCMYVLIQAELARLNGDALSAMELYDQAITTSREQGFQHYAGVANELAATFFLSRSQDKLARVYLTDARLAFVVWGATAKVQQLEELDQALFPKPPRMVGELGPSP